MKLLITTFIYLLFFLGVYAADSKNGESLHKENCISCHSAMTGGDGSVLYTRKDHRVTSKQALTKQVARCQSSLGLDWTESQINDVQQYLNQSFYQF